MNEISEKRIDATLNYLNVLEKETIDLSEPTKVFKILEYKRYTKSSDSGNYVFINDLNDEVLYVGVSVEIRKRMNAHTTYWTSKSSLCYNLFLKLGDKDKVLKFLENVKVMFWQEEDEFKQDFLEKYLICVLKPIFNKSRAKHSTIEMPFKLKEDFINKLRAKEKKIELGLNKKFYGDLKVIRIANNNEREDNFLLSCSCGSVVRYDRKDLVGGKALSCKGVNRGRHKID